MGEHGEIDVTPQRRDQEGRWRRHPTGKGKGVERWRARAYYRNHQNEVRDVSRVAPRRAQAEAAVTSALTDLLRKAPGALSAQTPLVEAGWAWLAWIEREGKSARTVADYSATFRRYVMGESLKSEAKTCALAGLTVDQANDHQRLELFLHAVADHHGETAARMAKTVLTGIVGRSVSVGALSVNRVRQIGRVKGRIPKETGRDTSRAFTPEERAHILEVADQNAASASLNPRSQAKAESVADFVAFMAGTGVRIGEARNLRWEHVDLAARTVQIHGTKTRAARRLLNLPEWLQDRLSARGERVGYAGLVFRSPQSDDPEALWEQSNNAGAVSAVIRQAGCEWATPHTFRRTVATMLHEAGVPTVRISDQLGHSDPAMTVSKYLGRDFEGDKSALAVHL